MTDIAAPAASKPMTSITEIRQRNAAKGDHWFSPDTLRFFKTRVGTTVYPCKANGGTYFVSSEKDDGEPRYYTVRWAAASGEIFTVGRFKGYTSRNGAHAAAVRICAEQDAPAGDAL